MISVLAAQVTDRQLIILVGGLIITTAIIFNRKIYVKVKNTEATVGGTDRQLNGRTKEESTVSDDVRVIRAELKILRDVTQSLHGTSQERLDREKNRIDVLTGRIEKIASIVQDDRHAIQNSLALLALSMQEIRGELQRPMVGIPIVDIAKGIERIQAQVAGLEETVNGVVSAIPLDQVHPAPSKDL